ncbi:sulfiredoxin Ecym_3406 [Eremothecium cymbalariae DBVPG|uniref:Sulfiredoxin n=1 Tax=Eremothecium cymbalariae (strain CBS 270.75 / DBVPG 7215 / KCTC 17166 / NRRL Y-17582) TaxID=931890 RepID=G8JRX3_ERECY|nr:Hypothetical protein Ecym_3406 [Eremothecium cymbalariae DBVPG\
MSIQTRGLAKIEYIPLSHIRRPIAPVLDSTKIDAMVSTVKGVPMASATCTLGEAVAMNGELPAIDVMHVREDGKDYYFAFGGCHRFQAYDRLSSERQEDTLVRCKIVPTTRKQLRVYVGASLDDMF